jgi:aminoglycoside phosphotransferase (APT) family kinase protein
VSEATSRAGSEDLERLSVSDDGLAGPLEQWLSRRLGVDELKVTELQRPRGGYSAETWLVDTTVGGAPRRFVVKRETPDPPIYAPQVPGQSVEVEFQYRIMDSLSRCPGVPVAPLVGFESDPAVTGQPFLAMEFVPGLILSENPAYTLSGPFAEASPNVRHEMVSHGLELLARMHAADWETAGLGWLRPERAELGHIRQLRIWEEFGFEQLRGRRHPEFEAGLRWLHDHQPEPGPLVFNWGDARLGNVIYDGTRCACVMDFEGACIAPAEVDLGWWMFFDRTMHEGAGQTRAQGDPSRSEQCDIYAAESGRTLGDLHWYEVLAAVKYAVIVVRVMNRNVDRGQMDPESEYWRKNAIVDCLDQVLGE